MSILRSSWLIIIAALIFGAAYFYRPGGVEGPRAPAVAPEGKGFDHSAFDAVLEQARLEDGSLNYSALKKSPEALDRYLGQLRAVSPASAPHRFKTNGDRLAYYINAYNAFIMALARDHCSPNIQDIHPGGGLYWRISFLMGEEEITLSDLESELIAAAAQGNEAIHFAIVKAAKGFYPIAPKALRGDTIEAHLDALKAAVLKDARIAERKGDTLYVSDLFRWYQPEFGSDPRPWIKSRAPELVAGDPKVEYRAFDWSLNGRCDGGSGS